MHCYLSVQKQNQPVLGTEWAVGKFLLNDQGNQRVQCKKVFFRSYFYIKHLKQMWTSEE